MKTAGERCDALVRAAEDQLAEAEAKAKDLVSEANSEASKVRIAAVKKAEGLLKEAEQKKSSLIAEATEIKAEAIREARAAVEEGKRELEVLIRRREDINADLRVQDVLEALESFEAPSAGKDGGVESGRCRRRNSFEWQVVRRLAITTHSVLCTDLCQQVLASRLTVSHPKGVSFSRSNTHPLDDTPLWPLGFPLSPHRSHSTGTP